MAVIVNWIRKQHKEECCDEVLLFDEKFKIYYFDNIIIKTEWCIEQSNDFLDKSKQWQNLQQYLNNPVESLTISLMKQGSDFRNTVWAEMCKIPVGQTMTYSKLARQINSGARAVANACRDNPFPGIIPCHRVVAVSGLGGYMGKTSGRALEIKRKLLAKEATVLANMEAKN